MLYQMHTFCQIITITMANLIWDRGAVHMSSPVHQSNPASAGQRLRTHRSTRLQGRDPVRSPIVKLRSAGLVVGSVTTSESPDFFSLKKERRIY
jgi:hypothetical protein